MKSLTFAAVTARYRSVCSLISSGSRKYVANIESPSARSPADCIEAKGSARLRSRRNIDYEQIWMSGKTKMDRRCFSGALSLPYERPVQPASLSHSEQRGTHARGVILVAAEHRCAKRHEQPRQADVVRNEHPQ